MRAPYPPKRTARNRNADDSFLTKAFRARCGVHDNDTMLLAPLAARKQRARTATEFRIEDFEHRKASCTSKVQHFTVRANVVRHGNQQLFIAQAAATHEYCFATAVFV